MRIAIYGAGAIGGHLAVRLGEQGHDVGVVARGEHLDAIVRDGLRLQVGDRTLRARPRASDDPADLGIQDVVFVTVKTTALSQVATGLATLIDGDTSVVFAQNGMPWWYPVGRAAHEHPLPSLPVFGLGETFLHLLDPAQVVPAIVYSANEILEPGVVRNNSPGRNAIEVAALVDSAHARVDTIRAMLEAADVQSPPVGDIRAAVWLKLIVNASASSIAVATGNAEAIAIDPAIRTTFERIVGECLAVAAWCGFDLADRLDVRRWTERRGRHKPSLLQDYERRKPMELAELVLAPAAFARTAGIATPTLDALSAVTRRLAMDRGLYVDEGA